LSLVIHQSSLVIFKVSESRAFEPRELDMTPDELSERLMRAAVRVGKAVDALPETRMGRHVAGQLVRCGTSAGPNYEEGRSAESRRDFTHKLKIALKELRETRYWLQFSVRAELLPESRLGELAQEHDELVRIIAKSISTVKARDGRSNDK
jgi:four helix bundle protein